LVIKTFCDVPFYFYITGIYGMEQSKIL
jgi:hypothetical protein